MKTVSILLMMLNGMFCYSTDVKLIIQKGNASNEGTTYRLYAQMPDLLHSVNTVYGTDLFPMSISSTLPLFQHSYGGPLSNLINENGLSNSQGLLRDSWLTIGYENSTNNGMMTAGINFESFEKDGNMSIKNGFILLPPDDAKTKQDANGLILLGQFTTTGSVVGTLNLSGWTHSRKVWKMEGLSFSTDEFVIFGCMDKDASNYSPQATFDDHSCLPIVQLDANISGYTESITSGIEWLTYPNPIVNGILEINFTRSFGLKFPATIDVLDLTGRAVYSKKLNIGEVKNGRFTFDGVVLRPGSYLVRLSAPEYQKSEMIIVK